MTTKITYSIDGNDKIRQISPEWHDFARDNDAEPLVPDRVVDRPIWEFVSGADVRDLYDALFQSIRKSLGTASFPFRCDSPSLRRFMELKITPIDDGGLSFDSLLLRTEARRPVALLDPSQDNYEDFFIVCSWCKKVEGRDGEWLEVEKAIASQRLLDTDRLPGVSHGICPTCADATREEIRRLNLSDKKPR